MSTGSVFTLLINNGKTDKLLNAYEFLKERIAKYIKEKDKSYNIEELLHLPEDGYLHIKDDILPSLNYIEQTHNTFVCGTYKPCIPISFEYIKQQYNSPKFGQTITFNIDKYGTFINDMVLRIKLTGLKAVDNQDRVRYVSFLGHKLLENVKFSVQNNPLDEYTTDDYNAYFNHELLSEQKTAWLRNIGQETPELAILTSDPSFDMHKEYRWIGNGNQTLKQKHDDVELLIPLLFWFKDIKNALPNHIIPWGQTNVTIKLAEVSDIVGFSDYGGGGAYISPTITTCELYTNNIFIPPEIFNLYSTKFSFNLIRVHRQHKQLLKGSSDSYDEVKLHNLKWPVETLYISFRPRDNLSLSQYWHKNTKLIPKNYKVPVVAKNNNTVITGTIVSASSSNGIAKAVITAGNLSIINNTYNNYDLVLTGGTGYNANDIIQNRYIISDYDGDKKEITLTTNWNNYIPNTTTTFELFTPELAINLVSYYEEYPIIKSMSLFAHGVEIYRDNPESFYSNYLPYRFGLSTGLDKGSYVMNFNLYPKSHHPSGSLNTSIARELYLRYSSNIINSSYLVDLIVISKCINFLLVSDGSAIIKYST
jgi:hypothetical protein